MSKLRIIWIKLLNSFKFFLRESIPIKGEVEMIAWYKGTNVEKERVYFPNLTVTVGKGLICDMLIDEAGFDTGLTYTAIGTDNTAPALSDTTLGTEAGTRQTITTKSRTVNVISLSTFFPVAACTVAIEEIAIFGHSTATASADSGVMFCRALLSYDNSGGNYDLTFNWAITIG